MSLTWAVRPSFAPVWGKCAGAIKASAPYPNNDTPETMAGTAAHWLVAEVLTACKLVPPEALAVVGDCARFLDATAPNGVVIDDKIVQGAQVMVDEVLMTAKEHYPKLKVEYAVHMGRIHPQNGGTLDVSLFIVERLVQFLWDYKNGHEEVSARENDQLIDYMEGLREELRLDGYADQSITAVFRIVQPFAYHAADDANEWVVPLSDIRPHVNRLAAKAAEAMSDDPSMTAGKHCYGCPAVGDCGVARQYGYHLVAFSDRPYLMDSMPMRDLRVERDILTGGIKALRARLKAIDDSLYHRIAAGEQGSGLTIQSTEGNLEWTVESPVAAALASQFGFDINKSGVKTPTQAKDACPREHKQAFKTVLKLHTKKPAKGSTLVDVANSRTARAFAKPTN